jgi:hypothetical protein
MPSAVVLLGSALALASDRAAATSPPDEAVVRWVAPTGCPDRAAMARAVVRYVGRPLADEAVRAEGEVSQTSDERFVLALRLSDGEGQAETRALEDADCAVLSDVAALMIAMAIDPEAAAKAIDERAEPRSAEVPAEAEPEAEVPAEAETPAEPQPQPQPEVAATPPVPRERPPEPRVCEPGPSRVRERAGALRAWCVGLAARVALQWGPLPRVGPGVGADAALLWPRVRIEAGGAFFFARPARVGAAASAGGDVRLGVGHGRGCARLGRGALEVPLCAGVEVGALRGIGVGIEHPRVDRLVWVGALADAGLAWAPVRRLALHARIGGVAPLVEHRFAVGGLGVVHAPAPVGLRAALAVELRLP